MKNRRALYSVFLPALMLLFAVPDLWAQRFSVASFRPLPNDVTAFINPVRDLNDEDCGLIKVMATEDFVFSTPLGIVKRDDKVGEIWLYIPRGSKKMTIKHAELGVLRDFEFPTRIESHMTYELRIDKSHHQRIDTLIVNPVKTPVPFNADIAATFNFGGKSRDISGGLLLTAMKRHGGFIHVTSDFGKIGTTIGECGKHGEIDGNIPFYSGRTRSKSFMINAGLAHRLSRRIAIFEGAGYGDNSVAWELAPSEGGGYVKNSYYCKRGLSFEVGVLLTFKRLVVSAAVMSLKGHDWFGSVGIGIRLEK